jgi:ATP-dependent Clp protease protease subunit
MHRFNGLRAFNGPVIPFRPVKDRPCYAVKAAGDRVGEVYLYDVIGESWAESGTTGKAFADDLKKLGALDTLNVYINSPGGSVFDGVAIHNVLRRNAARKIVHIDGLAASIASVIAMAGDEIRIAANGMMMIHDPWSIAIGSAAEMRKTADSLDKVRETILVTYVERATSSEETLSAWMTAETWFTAQEAVDAGLADTLTEKVEMAALAKFDLSSFARVPASLTEAAAAAGSTNEPAGKTEEGTPHPAIAQMEARLVRLGLDQRRTASA